MKSGKIVEQFATARICSPPRPSLYGGASRGRDARAQAILCAAPRCGAGAGGEGHRAGISSPATFAMAAPPPLRAVDGVSLTIHRARRSGWWASRAPGKSSLLRTLLALDRPQRGEVRLLGEGFSDGAGRAYCAAAPIDPGGAAGSLRQLRSTLAVERVIAEPYIRWMPPERRERRE
jgi:peptide/nickel transport system ATP-binding protein